MGTENDAITFATLWRPIEQQEERRRRLEHRLDENLNAADSLMAQALSEPVVRGSTGQLRANPLFVAAAAADAAALGIWRSLSELDAEDRETVFELVKAAARGDLAIEA